MNRAAYGASTDAKSRVGEVKLSFPPWPCHRRIARRDHLHAPDGGAARVMEYVDAEFHGPARQDGTTCALNVRQVVCQFGLRGCWKPDVERMNS